MKVTIITVCYNSESTIRDAIESVCDQDCKTIEYIVIDGGSSDGTAEIVREYGEHVTQFISEPDNGIYDAMNKGVSLATGEVIGFLNADDFLAYQSVISDIIDAMEASGSQAVYGDLQYVARDDANKAVRYWKAGAYIPGAFRKGWVPPHPTFYCCKEVYNQFGGFRNDFKVAADFELMLRFVEKHQIKMHYIPKIFVKMRTGGTANRTTGILRGNREILRSFRLNEIRLSPLFFIHKPIAKGLQLFRRRSVIE